MQTRVHNWKGLQFSQAQLKIYVLTQFQRKLCTIFDKTNVFLDKTHVQFSVTFLVPSLLQKAQYMLA